MDIALTCTWRPRNDIALFRQLRPHLDTLFTRTLVCLPPGVPSQDAVEVSALPNLTVLQAPARGWGRYLLLEAFTRTSDDFVLSVDMDFLLHWLQRNATECQTVTELLTQTDALVVGRTEDAFLTRPGPLQRTELITNAVTSHLIGRPMDVTLGCRGFSRNAAEFLLLNSRPGMWSPGLWGDGAWPVLLQRGGFQLGYYESPCATWETPDHYQGVLADSGKQQEVRQQHDQNAKEWSWRVEVAREIVEEALAAATTELQPSSTVRPVFP